MKKIKSRSLVEAASIAGLYAALTLLFAPISYGPVQVRIAEALTVLPAFTPAAVPGLFIGCLIANALGGLGIYDMIFGSLATLAAAFMSRLVRSRNWLVPLPPVILNALIVGSMLHFMYDMRLSASISWVALGQAIACYGLGYPLILYLRKHSGNMFKEQ